MTKIKLPETQHKTIAKIVSKCVDYGCDEIVTITDAQGKEHEFNAPNTEDAILEYLGIEVEYIYDDAEEQDIE